jgi:tRNA A-37 threonylcarbamoyl transferase component Bud32
MASDDKGLSSARVVTWGIFGVVAIWLIFYVTGTIRVQLGTSGGVPFPDNYWWVPLTLFFQLSLSIDLIVFFVKRRKQSIRLSALEVCSWFFILGSTVILLVLPVSIFINTAAKQESYYWALFYPNEGGMFLILLVPAIFLGLILEYIGSRKKKESSTLPAATSQRVNYEYQQTNIKREIPKTAYLLSDHYQIEKQLRVGGMAIITLAKDIQTDALCVIKTPRNDTQHDTKYNIDKLTLEAAYLRQFNHPNIVKYLDMFTHENILHLVVEYIDGEDMLTAFAKKQAEESRVIKWGGQILDALEHIHHFGLIHRDVNPGNIMLRKDDSVVLIDFGTVKPATGEGWTVVRKAGFEVPEQVATGHADVRSDIFGVGGVLFYLLTSTAPGFIGNRDVAELLVSKGVSQTTAKCIEQALRIKPEERFQSAAAMRKALGI